ncbi:hypothetical protein M9458_012349, partial [Cirrhinus mrigala]
HWINLKIVLATLIDRGHDVTVLVPDGALFVKAEESDRFSFQHFNVSTSGQGMLNVIEEFLYFSVYEMDQLNLLQIQMKFYELASKHQDLALSYCDGILKSTELMDKLRNRKFDVILTDPMYPAESSLGLYFTILRSSRYRADVWSDASSTIICSWSN